MRPRFTGDWPALGARIARMPGVIEGIVFAVLASNALTFGLAGSALAISAISTGIIVAGAIGLQLALQKTPASPKPVDVQTNIRQEISPRRRIYGRYLAGSVIVFAFRRGSKSYILHYICEGPIEGIVSFRLDRKPVTLDEDGYVTDPQYSIDDTPRVRILSTLGLMTDEPFDVLLDVFPELDTPLTPFRHRGCVMVLQIVQQVEQEKMADIYPNNMPGLQVVIDGLNDIYDPRDDSTGFTGNAGLCLLSEIMSVYNLTSADTEEINFEAFADFADHCDDDVGLKAGGDEPRYRCAGPIMMNAENEDRIKAIAAICNADVYMDAQGRISVRKRLDLTPGIALRAMNGDHLSIQLEGGRALQKNFNTVKVAYVDPNLNWKTNELTWQHAAYLAEDGEPRIEALNATLCPSGTQALRLAKLYLYEANAEYAGSVTSGPQALDLMENPVFTLDLSPEDDFERIASAAGIIEYDAENMVASTSFAVFAADAEDWDETVDEQEDVLIPPALPNNIDDVALDVTVTVELLENSAPILSFSWEGDSEDLPDDYGQEVEVSVAELDEWRPALVNQDLNTAEYGPVGDAVAYDWRIRNVTAGKKFDWQYSVSPVTVLADPVAPGLVTGLGIVVTGGVATVSFTTPNDPSTRLRSYRVFRAPAADTYPTNAIDVSGQRNVSPNQSVSFVDDQYFAESASYKWHVVTENHSGVQSSAASSSSYTAGPGALTSASVTGWTSVASSIGLGYVNYGYTAPASSAMASVKRYRCGTGVTLNKTTHLIDTVSTAASAVVASYFGDNTRTTLIVNGDMASATGWTLPAGSSISGGTLNISSPASAIIPTRTGVTIAAGTIRYIYTISGFSAGDAIFRMSSPTANGSATHTADGTYLGTATSTGAQTSIGVRVSASTVLSLDEFAAYEATGSCLTQGVYDYYFEAVDTHGNVGPLSGPHTVTVV